MPLSQEDRIVFSLQIIESSLQLKNLDISIADTQADVEALQKIDNANKNLLTPMTARVNQYQLEWNHIDGNIRSTFTEQDLLDSANKKISNFFFPNNTQITVPSLAAFDNVWTKLKPFALTYGIGKNYTEGYGSGTSEQTLITEALAFISDASAFTDIQNTSGQHCEETGTCSIPINLNEIDCLADSGIWTPGPDSIVALPAVQTLKTNLVNKINALKAHLLSEVAQVTLNDPDSAKQSQNNAAINNINNVIIPALDLWLAYSDFNTSHGQTTCAGFNSYDADLLAPTKLHSDELTALSLALTSRQTFLTTRISQLNTNLGTITQDLNTGEVTGGSGLYRLRYNFITLRLNAINGSLSELAGAESSIESQNEIKSSIAEKRDIYMSILPTSAFLQSGSDTQNIFLKNSSLFSPGDTIYIMAEGQQELLRAIKSISGNIVTLNDVVPTKYRIVDSLRAYKDLT